MSTIQPNSPLFPPSLRHNYLLLGGLAVGLVCIPELATATVLDNFGNAVLGILDNTFLRALAIVAVIAAGLMALSGRIQWMIFITILLATVIIFGAAGIVDYIRTNSSTGTTAAVISSTPAPAV